VVQSQPGQVVLETLATYLKNSSQKRADEVALSSNPSTAKRKKKKKAPESTA
jgi:hypothetical protein